MASEEYSPEEKKELLQLARQTIETYLETGKKEVPETGNPKFLEKRGVFVTLHSGGKLRGCIGYPLPTKSLVEAVVDNAVSSSTEDYRFQPVTGGELKHIDIEISVLTDFLSPHGVDKEGAWMYLKCPNCSNRSRMRILVKTADS